jgi:addiction module HigA family antidote
MAQRLPTHPGAILREDVLPKLKGITKSEFAKILGISRQTLYGVLAERTRVSAEMALRLGTLLGNGAQFWLDMQTQFDLWQAQEKLHDELNKMKPLNYVAKG